jgi:hypothetical protein
MVLGQTGSVTKESGIAGMELSPAIQQFFSVARERERIRLKREAGQKKPWTDDKIFRAWRFCNVHRENDKTSVWFRDNIRKPLLDADPQKQIESTIIFRWFNRIQTGEKIKDLLLGQWDTEEARDRLRDEKPVVTGAYIIKGPDGYSKLDGVLYCVNAALDRTPEMTKRWGSTQDFTLQEAWEDLVEFYYLGPFMAYEIVTDLRWTPVLGNAPDIMTWANAGPGCARGLGWIIGDQRAFNSNSAKHQLGMLSMMEGLLEYSKTDLWPSSWQPWEMREVEHWLCEFDKYKRAERGDDLKRRFK